MVNDKGTSIANANKDKVLKMDNIIENAKKDQSLKAMADTVQNMLKGSSGNSHYVYAGEEKYIGYAPVKGTAWVLAVTDGKKDILSGLDTLKMATILLSAFFLIAGIIGAAVGIAATILLMNNKDEIGDSIDGLKDMMSDTVRTGKSKIDRIIADSEDKLDELKKKSQALTEDLLKESTEKIDDVKKMINKELKKKK